MTAQAQIASHLNISSASITRCEEWASVWFVVITGRSARFVSKKVVKMSSITKKFPAVPVKLYLRFEVDHFHEAIALGAGRIVTWTIDGVECSAKIAYKSFGLGTQLCYVTPQADIPVKKFLEAMENSGIEYEVKYPLTRADYQYG
jgi:hypothetical protein